MRIVFVILSGIVSGQDADDTLLQHMALKVQKDVIEDDPDVVVVEDDPDVIEDGHGCKLDWAFKGLVSEEEFPKEELRSRVQHLCSDDKIHVVQEGTCASVLDEIFKAKDFDVICRELNSARALWWRHADDMRIQESETATSALLSRSRHEDEDPEWYRSLDASTEDKPGGRNGDSPFWVNPSGYDCDHYAGHWCKDGAFRAGSEWTGGAQYRWPERNCKACGKNSPDTPGWSNPTYDCDWYGEHWCKEGSFRAGSEWTGGAQFLYPELNCVVCGKGRLLPWT